VTAPLVTQARRGGPRSRLALAAAALALSGCFLVLPQSPRPGPDEGDWARARAAFTRGGKIYDQLSTEAFATAVYQAPEVREARVRRSTEWAASTAEEREAALARERDESARFEDFVVALFTPDRADNDLDARQSVWRVALVVAGEGEALPESISQVRPDALLRELYPFLTEFDTVYRVRFARWKGGPIAARPFLLRLAGARGRLDLDFGKKPEAARGGAQAAGSQARGAP
jgi:hypothetical protein